MDIKILEGNSLDVLRTLPDQSVHCCVTSPPYWGLRDYGTAKWEGGNPFCNHEGADRFYTEKTAAACSSDAFSKAGPDNAERLRKGRWREGGQCVKCGAVHSDAQIGLEQSLGEHISALVNVFREVRRVLRYDGTLWINYGDAYASSPNGRSAADTGNDDRTFRDKPISTVGGSFKPKDRMLLPARVAIALQDDDWWIRDEIVWHKPNPMPSSVKDRTTPAHEMIYMLTKNPRYYYDQKSVLEPCSPSTHARLSQDVQNQVGSARANGGTKTNGNMKAVSRKSWKGSKFDGERDRERHPDVGRNRALPGSGSMDAALAIMPEMRNPRSVWTISPKGFKEAHFATFPPDLIRPCILAGCPFGGVVLDPFFGAGTTALVARELGRNTIGIELNPEYVNIAKRRLGIATRMPWENKLP